MVFWSWESRRRPWPPSLPRVASPSWSLSKKISNKLQHSLNGNLSQKRSLVSKFKSSKQTKLSLAPPEKEFKPLRTYECNYCKAKFPNNLFFLFIIFFLNYYYKDSPSKIHHSYVRCAQKTPPPAFKRPQIVIP